jgi:uncharacterized protein YbcV (DUF1398 family)
MTPEQIATATACHLGAVNRTMSFPDILGTLAATGFESYFVDYRTGSTRYYLTTGHSTEMHGTSWPVARAFAAQTISTAIREAQTNGPDYSYLGFCRKVTEAGCAGYFVSLAGRRVVYFGRTAETHVEHFPAKT